MKKVINISREVAYNVLKYVKKPEKLICKICEYDNYKFAPLFSDKLYLKVLFKKYMKTKLNLSNPVTFNEKLQWLKLYDRNSEYTIMVDKYKVKEYVSKKIGNQFIIPTIGVYDDIDDVPFDDLPDNYVIKCTHDSGSIFICSKNADCDIEQIKKKLSQKLKMNFFWYSREWAYKDVKPRIIVEEFISDENGNCPVDYKFFCFNGNMKVFKIDYNRFTKRASNYYNSECEFLEFGEVTGVPDSTIKLELPENFKEMVKIAETLSQGIPFLRVDLYSIKNHIYFGELTFYPASGLQMFVGDGDNILGDYLVLPKKCGGKNNE